LHGTTLSQKNIIENKTYKQNQRITKPMRFQYYDGYSRNVFADLLFDSAKIL